MIREITKQQIDAKTAQGERVVLIEVQSTGEGRYDTRHLPGAMLMHVSRVRELASQYLPDPAAEIVIYSEDQFSSATDTAAWQLSGMGYGNIYVYRGGKRDWFGASGFAESTHMPPKPGEVASYAGNSTTGDATSPRASGPRKEAGEGVVGATASLAASAMSLMSSARMASIAARSWRPLLRMSVWGLAAYGAYRLVQNAREQRSRRVVEPSVGYLNGTDEVSEIPLASEEYMPAVRSAMAT
jgi:rhodanese-related sulfurtransferase